MKTRQGFVSNSSSTAFIITNKTDRTLKLVDFVRENPQLVEEYNDQYGYEGNPRSFKTQEDLIACAKERDEDICPGSQTMVFGDEDYDVIGSVFDYILREGGSSESFHWRFKEYYR